MFLTEGPYQGTSKPVHQITVDILDLNLGLEEIFSTHLLWDRRKGRVTFDSVTIKQFGRQPSPAELPAKDLKVALAAAVRLANAAWNRSLWKALTKRLAETGN